MKKIIYAVLVPIIICSGTFYAIAKPGLEAMPPGSLQGKTLTLSIEKATEDISGNIPFLIAVHAETDAAVAKDWEILIADKIPTQPVAVIQLLAHMNNAMPDVIYVQKMCPRDFIEDTASYDQMVDWMERAATALEVFTMIDPREEAMRRACLEEIQKALADKETWKF